MIRYLLDTNIISEPAKRRPYKNVVEKCSQHSGEIAIPGIVWHELIFGMMRSPEGKKRYYIAHYLSEVVYPCVTILSYNETAAEWHVSEWARLEKAGRVPGFSDGIIAAVAIISGLVLVTRNVKDFERFEELETENWFEL